MVIKYSKQLVLDYINGEDLPDGIDIDELENNSQFMKMVIEHTNDKKMYDFCGDDVKNDCEFVKNIIDKFKGDIPFVVSVAREFLKNNKPDDRFEEESYDNSHVVKIRDYLETDELYDKNRQKKYDCAEIDLMMSELYKVTGDDSLYEFAVRMIPFREEIMIELELGMTSEDKDLGMDFLILQQMLSGRRMLVDYFARILLERIFDGDNDRKASFEQMVHKDVDGFEKIESMGINNYLISVVRRYDAFLAEYVSCHLELLDGYRKRLVRIGNNWKYYIASERDIKQFAFIKGINNYYIDNEDNRPSIIESDLIEYVIKKRNLEEYFRDDDYEEVQYEPDIDENKLSLADLRAIQYAMRLADELFGDGRYDEELDDYLIPESKGPGTVVTFKGNKK